MCLMWPSDQRFETPVAEDDLTVIQTGNELLIYNFFRRYTSCVCVRTADD